MKFITKHIGMFLIISLSLWICLFIALCILLSNPAVRSESSEVLLNKIQVFNEDRSGYIEWDREKALEFELDQITKTINYLFVAAAALLALIIKFLIDPTIENREIKLFGPVSKLLFFNSAMGLVTSMLFGFYGFLYFNNVADQESFSIYGEVGVGSLFQILTFSIGALLFIFVLMFMLGRVILDKPRRRSQKGEK
jgi:hypothetical protein